MRGRVPPRSVAEIAEAAARVFMAKGYREAGISDVSSALGLSHGAVYTYAKSKEALLYLALLLLTRPESLPDLETPVPTPSQEQLRAAIDRGIGDFGLPVLTAAAQAEAGPAAVAEEFGAIVDELYSFVEHHRDLLAFVEHCARDLPELAEFYFVRRRRAVFARLGDYLAHRADALRPVPDRPAAARFIAETIAWFAAHRHGDPDSAMLDDEDCRRTVRHLLLAAFVPEVG